MAAKLVDLFVENFAQFADQVDEGVAPGRAQGPAATSATEAAAQATPAYGPVVRSGPPKDPINDRISYPDCSPPTPISCISAKGLLARTLPREEWTHEAHLAATTYLLLQRPDIDLDAELPGLIRRYNESVGGVNSDTEGYHETITRVFLHGVRLFLGEADAAKPLHELVNELLLSPMGRRDWPLRFYSRERLFSVEARRNFVEPDLARASLNGADAAGREHGSLSYRYLYRRRGVPDRRERRSSRRRVGTRTIYRHATLIDVDRLAAACGHGGGHRRRADCGGSSATAT